MSRNGLRFIVFLVCIFSSTVAPAAVFASTTYDFNADTLGAAPANTTPTGGTLQVVNDGTLGKSLQSVTQNGFISGLIFDQFASSTDYSVSWKQAYSSSGGADGMILRAQTSSMGYAGHTDARLGYLFQINGSTAYVWKTTVGGFTMLSSTSFTKASPQYYKAVLQGSNLGFYYSNDGSSYTRFASSTDSTYTAGLTQYTAGYGAGTGIDTIDDVTYTNLAGDTTAPIVTSFSPADDTTATSTISTLRINFSENVTVGSGNITIKKTSDNSIVETIAVGSGQVTGGGTSTITITPSTTLSYNTGYYVQIANTAFTDASSNAFAGISDTTTWNFTTMNGGGSGLVVQTPQAPTISLGGASGTTAKILFATNNQGVSLSGVGFEYWKKETNKQKVDLSYAPQSWIYQLADLSCATTYTLRGYTMNTMGTIYSDPISFTTSACSTSTATRVPPKKVTLTAQAPEKTAIVFVRDLQAGDTGTDVSSLQTLLITANNGAAAHDLARVGASGYFSTYTKKALIEYQKKYLILPATGYFGKATRTQMKSQKLSVWW